MKLPQAALLISLIAIPAATAHAQRATPSSPTTVVSRFTTYFEPGQPRVINIRRAARLLDREVILPGHVFSMNAALGRRTRARGFVPAPMISGGVLVNSVGGGISQVATTLYNAAFFAGLRLIAHTPHSFYISRYPIGREATISWGGPELTFQNDWPSPVLMRFRTNATSITVTFYSQRLGRHIAARTTHPYGFVRPVTRYVRDPTLAPGRRILIQPAGGPGFSVDYSRRVYENEELRRNEHFHVRYDAVDEVVAVSGR
jgi:vancomycin resistance protein YoaR